MNEESTGGMVIPLGITSTLMRNPPEECLFRRELLAQEQGIHRRNGIPLGFTSLLTRNPPDEGNSAGKYRLIYENSDQRKIFRTVTIPGSAAPNPLYCQCELFKNLNTKILLK
jgi:hypothetical protein